MFWMKAFGPSFLDFPEKTDKLVNIEQLVRGWGWGFRNQRSVLPLDLC